MTTTTLTPFDTKNASKVGRRVFRKQILPKTTINYKGQEITFDEPFLRDLAESYRQGAYDQVPFVFADPDNRHNMDPERFRGEVVGFELAEDGLDAIISVTKKGAKVLEENPRLGVSARIVEGLVKSDGRQYPRAIQHVLATMDPRVTGMRGWQAVDLAVYNGPQDEVVDLTSATYEEHTVTGKQKTGTAAGGSGIAEGLDLSNMTDAEFQQLLDLTQFDEGQTEADVVNDPNADVRAGTVPKRKGRYGDGRPDDTPRNDDRTGRTDLSNTDLDDDEDDEEDDLDEDDADDDVDVSGDGGTGNTGGEPHGTHQVGEGIVRGATELSNPVNSNALAQVTEARKLVAATRWRSQRDKYMQAGVPRPLLDLAEPVMASPDSLVLDLSTADEPVDARQVITSMLEASAGIVDLTADLGHQVDLSEDEQSKTQDLLKVWDTEYGKI